MSRVDVAIGCREPTIEDQDNYWPLPVPEWAGQVDVRTCLPKPNNRLAELNHDERRDLELALRGLRLAEQRFALERDKQATRVPAAQGVVDAQRELVAFWRGVAVRRDHSGGTGE